MKLKVKKSSRKKKRVSGFRARMKTKAGRKCLSRRRRRGKKQLTQV